eukprot:CAMPEP_0119035252 /NCGR_PEP_ID=MMETSP1177-20130426/2187_1 /TAXON_ID=2985 /ORGANISM="Ochromonas sp, Strain CCMP1899" /LENGTH=134 /DNA_ID=CAMNT_0006993249 /DNA_START=144 /DNA_END=548 /DNA_ORIENTATION=-
MNQLTFWQTQEILDEQKTPSAVYFRYGDPDGIEDEVLSEGLSSEQFEEILKEKIKFGMTLQKTIPVEEQEAADNDPELNRDLDFKFANRLKKTGIDMKQVVKEKRLNNRNNGSLDLPTDIVESYNYVKYMHDSF